MTARLQPPLPVQCEDDKESHRTSLAGKPREFGTNLNVMHTVIHSDTWLWLEDIADCTDLLSF